MTMPLIPFNKPSRVGNEILYIEQSVASGRISGDGLFTKKCHQFFESRYQFNDVLLTTSCTSALEMMAILLDIKAGDEVIVPSFTFVSTANAFALRGAKIVFADSLDYHPNVDPEHIARLITPKTKAIVVVHYAGVACDMDSICSLSRYHNIPVLEDSAQAINSYYDEKPLGSLGLFGSFSFHETKNIVSGEGGLLIINKKEFLERAEIIREKGTNRSSFFRGDVDKYGWVDVGSSYLPSDILAAYLYAQLESLDEIQKKRLLLWHQYRTLLEPLTTRFGVKLPFLPSWSTNNAHIFYLVCRNLNQRTLLISLLADRGIMAPFHYQSLHKSKFYSLENSVTSTLKNSEMYSDCLVRLPLYYDLTLKDVDYICDHIISALVAIET